MSGTPRMKAAQRIESECKVKEIWRVGCQLERELAAAQQRIKQLEEAGDALYENSDPTRWDSLQAANRKLDEQEAWRKAKEAKL